MRFVMSMVLVAVLATARVWAETDSFSLIVENNVVTGYDGTCPNSVTIPAGVEGIGNNAFCWNDRLSEITIPASVKSIGDWAFDNATGLVSVVFLGDRNKIRFGRAVFRGTPYNDQLAFTPLVYDGVFTGFQGQCPKEVRFADGVKTIASMSMDASSYGDMMMNLCKVTIPKSVTEIGDYAFWGCTNLSEVVYLGGESKISFGSEVFFMEASCISVGLA